MPDTAKLNNIVLEALQSRGYSHTEAKYFIKQLITNGIKSKKGVGYHKHNKDQKIDIFI